METLAAGLTVLGLILDLVGALVLTRGVILSRETAERIASGGTMGGQMPHLRDELLRQSGRAKRGAVLLAFGFLGQLLGAVVSTLAGFGGLTA